MYYIWNTIYYIVKFSKYIFGTIIKYKNFYNEVPQKPQNLYFIIYLVFWYKKINKRKELINKMNKYKNI